jgi:hypothetical protein
MSILATRTRPAGVTGLVKGVAGNSCELGFKRASSPQKIVRRTESSSTSGR